MPWETWASTTSCTTTDNCAWTVWQYGAGDTTTWDGWTSNGRATGTGDSYSGWVRAVDLTPAQQSQARRDADARAKARREKEEKAKKRAMRMLRRHLTRVQKKQLDQDKAFELVGPSGIRYRIECHQRMHNVFELNEQGRKVREFCIYATGQVPAADNWLAQKLLLEADEQEFKRIANAKVLAA